MEDLSVRKIVADLDEEERQALLALVDFGLASFSAGLVVEVLGFCVGLIS
jgi:hypothetical protein